MQNRHTFDRVQFDSIFKVALQERKITIPYLLEVQDKKPEVTDTSKKNQKNIGLTVSVANYKRIHPDYPVQTIEMLVNTYGTYSVYAAFKDTTGLVLKKLFPLLVLSVLLFILVNGALLYVVKTITRQKKIALIKNDFVNNMTHELSTPIMIATTAVDIILHHLGTDDKERMKKNLLTARNELLHLGSLTDRILSSAVEDQQHLYLRYEWADLPSIIKTQLENYRLTTLKKASLHYNGPSDLKLRADRIHLANAISNLLDNAIKYSAEPVLIKVNVTVKTSSVCIEVMDNGIGISKEYTSQIFTSFFRIPQGNLHNVKGFGLGLSYVKKVAEAHKGSIAVQSRPGVGTQFFLSLPFNNSIYE